MTGSSQVRVGDSVLPVTQELLSDSSAIATFQLSPEGANDGATARYGYTLAMVAFYAQQYFAKHRRSLSDDVQAIPGSLQQTIETHRRAAEALVVSGADAGSIKEFR